MELFSNLFLNNLQSKQKAPKVDLQRILSNIEEREKSKEIPPGKKIYDFSYSELQVRFDWDITTTGESASSREKRGCTVLQCLRKRANTIF